MIVGLVTFTRSNRGVETWRNPVMVLTRAQRNLLLEQIRGGTPLDSTRIRLARILARQQDVQLKAMLTNVGLSITFVGQWVLEPTAARAFLAVFLLVLLAVFAPLRLHRARGVRRFLEEHPADD